MFDTGFFTPKANLVMFCTAFILAILGLWAGIARASESRPSTVFYDAAGRCLYWSWDDESQKLNPCGPDEKYVPENASVECAE